MDSPSGADGVLLDHAQDIIVLVDEDGDLTYANEATERILGYETDDLEGTNAFQLIHPDDVDVARECFERTLACDEFAEYTVTCRLRAADESWVWLENRISNLTDDELDGYVISSRDVTQQVAAERDRAETENRIREIATTSGDVLWMFTSDWSELLFINPAYEAVYGGSVEELHRDSRSFLEQIHPEDEALVLEAMASLSEGQSVDIEYRVNPAQEYDVWVWVQAQPVIEDGEVVRIVGFSRDITDRRRRERQLYVMDNLLRHNLRNDLSVILGNAKLIEDGIENVDERTAVIRRTSEDLLASAEKQREIIDLLTSDVSRQEIDIDTVLERCVETVESRFPDAVVEVSARTGLTGAAITEFRLAIIELLENAIIHNVADQPVVQVTVRAADDEVVIAFDDRAEPIPDIEARVLSGEYEMSDVYHSSGLGLWLVYWVVELSDGRIDVSVTASGGNRIEVRIDKL